MRLLLLPLLLALGASPARHPLSVSRLLVEVQGDAVVATIRVQARTLLEVPALGLDAGGDGRLSGGELLAGEARLQEHLERRLTITLDGTPWSPVFEEFREVPPQEVGIDVAAGFEWIAARARLATDARVRAVAVSTSLFFEEGNPGHVMNVGVTGLRGTELLALLRADRREADFEGVRRPFLEYTRLGVEHVLSGYDHLAFLLALLLGVVGFRALLGTVTAFTLAHSITLVLSALEVLRLPAAFVEPGIALSIVLVLWLHLAQGPRAARPWLPAFVFGLLHGFGFAGVLGEIGLPPGARALGLLGFNAGVELGQLGFVLPVVILARLLSARLRRAARNEARPHAGALLGAAGLHFFARSVEAGWMREPAAWAPLLVSVPAGALVVLVLWRRATPEGQPLRAPAATSLLLATLYEAGAWLGSV